MQAHLCLDSVTLLGKDLKYDHSCALDAFYFKNLILKNVLILSFQEKMTEERCLPVTEMPKCHTLCSCTCTHTCTHPCTHNV